MLIEIDLVGAYASTGHRARRFKKCENIVCMHVYVPSSVDMTHCGSSTDSLPLTLPHTTHTPTPLLRVKQNRINLFSSASGPNSTSTAHLLAAPVNGCAPEVVYHNLIQNTDITVPPLPYSLFKAQYQGPKPMHHVHVPVLSTEDPRFPPPLAATSPCFRVRGPSHMPSQLDHFPSTAIQVTPSRTQHGPFPVTIPASEGTYQWRSETVAQATLRTSVSPANIRGPCAPLPLPQPLLPPRLRAFSPGLGMMTSQGAHLPASSDTFVGCLHDWIGAAVTGSKSAPCTQTRLSPSTSHPGYRRKAVSEVSWALYFHHAIVYTNSAKLMLGMLNIYMYMCHDILRHHILVVVHPGSSTARRLTQRSR